MLVLFQNYWGNPYRETGALASRARADLDTALCKQTGTPTKVKTVSGLSEYDESIQSIRGIGIHDVSVNSTHVAVVLDDSVTDPITKQSFGNDVFVFGHNAEYQLGTGKRSNLAIPQHIPPSPYRLTQEVENMLADLKTKGESKSVEEGTDSGTVSHMPHNRMQLAPRKGKLEERIVCGCECALVDDHE
jgi:hypothetical protein